jgi:hypothetical protein
MDLADHLLQQLLCQAGVRRQGLSPPCMSLSILRVQRLHRSRDSNGYGSSSSYNRPSCSHRHVCIVAEAIFTDGRGLGLPCSAQLYKQPGL